MAAVQPVSTRLRPSDLARYMAASVHANKLSTVLSVVLLVATPMLMVQPTSGRMTLGGEGLQHQDGSSQLVAATIPNCKAYDPAFAGEMAVIVDAGMREMLVEQRDVFYYVTLGTDGRQRCLRASRSRRSRQYRRPSRWPCSV